MCVCRERDWKHWDDDAETRSADVQPRLRPAAQEEHRQQSARWRAANTLPSVIAADRGSVAYTAATKRPGVYGELKMKERSVGGAALIYIYNKEEADEEFCAARHLSSSVNEKEGGLGVPTCDDDFRQYHRERREGGEAEARLANRK